jgi:dipeptide/tripeptide permease
MMGVWFLGTAYSEILAHSVLGKLSALEPGASVSAAESAAKYGDLFLLTFWIGLGAAVVAFALVPLLRRGMGRLS